MKTGKEIKSLLEDQSQNWRGKQREGDEEGGHRERGGQSMRKGDKGEVRIGENRG